jgi:hypothetical protein
VVELVWEVETVERETQLLLLAVLDLMVSHLALEVAAVVEGAMVSLVITVVVVLTA